MIRYMLIWSCMSMGFKFEDSLDTVTMDVSSPDQLTCWTCVHTELNPNPNCVYMINTTLIKKTTCTPQQTYCQIKKRTSNSYVEWFERSCVGSCDPSCQQLKPLRQCYWCCKHSLCNTGSGATDTHLHSCNNNTWIHVLYLLLMYFV